MKKISSSSPSESVPTWGEPSLESRWRSFEGSKVRIQGGCAKSVESGIQTLEGLVSWTYHTQSVLSAAQRSVCLPPWTSGQEKDYICWKGVASRRKHRESNWKHILLFHTTILSHWLLSSKGTQKVPTLLFWGATAHATCSHRAPPGDMATLRPPLSHACWSGLPNYEIRIAQSRLPKYEI